MKLDLASIIGAAQAPPPDGEVPQDLGDAGLFSAMLGTATDTTAIAEGDAALMPTALLDPEMHAIELALGQSTEAVPGTAIPIEVPGTNVLVPGTELLTLAEDANAQTLALPTPTIDVKIEVKAEITPEPIVMEAPLAHAEAQVPVAAIPIEVPDTEIKAPETLTQAAPLQSDATETLVALPEQEATAELPHAEKQEIEPEKRSILTSPKHAERHAAAILAKHAALRSEKSSIDDAADLASDVNLIELDDNTDEAPHLQAAIKHELLADKNTTEAASPAAVIVAAQAATAQKPTTAPQKLAAETPIAQASDKGVKRENGSKQATSLDDRVQISHDDQPSAEHTDASFAQLLDDANASSEPQPEHASMRGVISNANADESLLKDAAPHLIEAKSERAMEIARAAQGLAERPIAQPKQDKASVATMDLALSAAPISEEPIEAEPDASLPSHVRIQLGKAEARETKATFASMPAQKWVRQDEAAQSKSALPLPQASVSQESTTATVAANAPAVLANAIAETTPAELAARSLDARREVIRARVSNGLQAITSKPAAKAETPVIAAVSGKEKASAKLLNQAAANGPRTTQATASHVMAAKAEIAQQSEAYVADRKHVDRAADVAAHHVATRQEVQRDSRRSEIRAHEAVHVEGRIEETKYMADAQTARPVAPTIDVNAMPAKLPTPTQPQLPQSNGFINPAAAGGMFSAEHAGALLGLQAGAHADATPVYVRDSVIRNANAEIEHPELGRIEIAMRAEAGGVSLKAATHTEVAAAVLVHAEPELRRSMNDKGVSMKNFKVALRNELDSSESIVRAGRNVQSLLNTEA